MIEAVIFDLDGTLIHLPIDYEAFFKKVKKISKLNEVKPLTQTIASLDFDTRQKVLKEWEKAEWEAFQRLAINEKGLQLYRKYMEKPKALVTMQNKEITEKILKHLKISFNIIVTREDSLNRQEQIKMAITRLGKKPENILVIGDTENDKVSSEKIGCKFHWVEE